MVSYLGDLGQPGLRKGVLSGEACEREVAAYLLDKDHFANVPPTILARAYHPSFTSPRNTSDMEWKIGSLQEYVYHDTIVGNISCSKFEVEQVHKLVLLDMRLLNTDRNEANLLVRNGPLVDGKTTYELIPIDHGYCLPDRLEIGWCDWCWLDWPQLKVIYSIFCSSSI